MLAAFGMEIREDSSGSKISETFDKISGSQCLFIPGRNADVALWSQFFCLGSSLLPFPDVFTYLRYNEDIQAMKYKNKNALS
ncbi:hypothetical protein [Brevibacillus sp. 179-C9.3 HS]|uniref:hypothetical protein n=1 Tax=unclassified Brevibacillus TaxID=2684853 RepID=UPI0039A3DEE8